MNEKKRLYTVIYADPPWSYNDTMAGEFLSAEYQYKTQGLDWIKSLPVSDLSMPDSVLFLWMVSPLMPEALDVMNAWGFKYKTVAFCWNKTTVGDKWVSNLGRWTMGNIELCLLGTRGHPKRVDKTVKQQVIARRTVHSKKPGDVRERIEDLMGDVSRVELFARGDKETDLFGRNKFDGWDVWGDGVPSDLEIGDPGGTAETVQEGAAHG